MSLILLVITASVAFTEAQLRMPWMRWDRNVMAFFGAWSNPCAESPLKGTPTCDTSKSFEERAYDLVYRQIARLDDALLIYQGLTGNGARAVNELNIASYQWWGEALHGVAHSPSVDYDSGPIKNTTMFPQVITTAASFNASLFKQIGAAVSNEARAMFNFGQAGLTFWAPNINIFRDPRWGRGQETPGEDPFLNAVYATQFVSGMQDGDEKYLKVSACCKHYADYSLEGADGYSRHTFDAVVSEYDQNDTYLVAFKYCAVGGHASSVMCSYNAVDGIPSCASRDILTTKLRQEWQFEGYITSDCGAVANVLYSHAYTNSTGATIDAVFGAGMDINCGGFTQKYTADAVRTNNASLSEIQAAVYRAAMVQFRLGLFDEAASSPWASLGPSDVCAKSNLNLAYEASQQGIVLLKNKKNILPLRTSSISSVANIGPNAAATSVMMANYHGVAPFVISVQEGLKMYVDSVNYEKGVDIDSNDVSGISKAVQAAASATAVVLVVGIDNSQEGEGRDRTNITLPGEQNTLIREVAAAAKGGVILVVLSGGCLDISEWRDSDDIDAIIWGGYPGMYGGKAIADVIFGAFNPTGRLTQTFYLASYMNEILMDDMNMRGNETGKTPGRGYRYYSGDVVYPFGAGMSYTTFECKYVQETNGKLVTTVANTGEMDGGVVVLLYFVPNNAGRNGVELKRLVAFQRVDMLKVGAKQKLILDIYPEFANGQEHKTMDGQYVASCPN